MQWVFAIPAFLIISSIFQLKIVEMQTRIVPLKAVKTVSDIFRCSNNTLQQSLAYAVRRTSNLSSGSVEICKTADDALRDIPDGARLLVGGMPSPPLFFASNFCQSHVDYCTFWEWKEKGVIRSITASTINTVLEFF